jgi:HTH-type transcriptional regulator/antitoxin HipB
MRITSIRDVAGAMRGRRTDLGLSQAALARRAGVSRKWISEFEAGNLSAEIGLVLRVLDALGMALDLISGDDAAPPGVANRVDLDELLSAQRDR